MYNFCNEVGQITYKYNKGIKKAKNREVYFYKSEKIKIQIDA